MSKPQRIQQLEALASSTIGDGKSPDLFFVTDQGVVVTVSRDYDLAYGQWKELSRRYPKAESALESRKIGVLASVEPETEHSQHLVVRDDTSWIRSI